MAVRERRVFYEEGVRRESSQVVVVAEGSTLETSERVWEGEEWFWL
jgi:hypothetical protein